MRVKTSHVFYLVQVVILAVVYFGVAKLGLALSFYEGVVTLVWPPTGIALAAILLFGYRLWPGLVLGAFLANISTGAPLGFAVGTAIGNPLAAVVGAYLLRRWVGFQNSLERVRDVLGLVFLGAAVGTLVSATIGVASLCLNGMATWAAYGSVWWEWWLGDAMGVLIVAPPLLTWGARPRVSGSPWRIVEAGVLLILLVMVSLSVYSGWFAQAVTVPLSYAIFPLAIWAALRFGPRGVATVTLIWTGLAVWGTARGFGPFGQVPVPVGLLYLNLTTMGSVAALLLAAIIAERARAEETTVRLASFPELNPNPIIEVDLAGRIQYLNPAARRLFPDLEPKAPLWANGEA